MQLQFSNAIITNCLIGDSVDPKSLKRFLDFLAKKQLFTTSTCLNPSAEFFDALPHRTIPIRQYFAELSSNPSDETILGKSQRAVDDIFFIQFSPVWVDFMGDRSYYPKPMPFVLDCNLTLWALSNFPSSRTSTPTQNFSAPTENFPTVANAYLMVMPESCLKLVLDHYQYLAFIHVMDRISKTFNLLESDSRCFTKEESNWSTIISCNAPVIELTLVLPKNPPQSPYEEQNKVPKSSPESKNGKIKIRKHFSNGRNRILRV